MCSCRAWLFSYVRNSAGTEHVGHSPTRETLLEPGGRGILRVACYTVCIIRSLASTADALLLLLLSSSSLLLSLDRALR